MSQYEQYQKFYRLFRTGLSWQQTREFANEFGMMPSLEKAYASYINRNCRMKPIDYRLKRYKQRKAADSNLAYAA